MFTLAAISCGGGGSGGATPPTPSPSGNPAPTVSSVSPWTINAGASAPNITVSGNNFVAGAVVNLDAIQLATQFVSSAQLTASVPSSTQILAGTHAITVTNPPPGGGTSSTAAQLTIAPTLAAVAPDAATVGSVVSVTVFGADVNTPANNVLTFTQTGRKFTVKGSGATASGSGVSVSVTVPVGLVPATAASSIAAPATLSASINSTPTGNSLPFEVQPPSHALTISPGSAEQGTTLSVALAGSFTAFGSSTSLSSDDLGLGLSNIVIRAPDFITATLAIAGAVPAGHHVLTVTSGSTPVAFDFVVLPASTAAVTLSGLSVTSAAPLAPMTITGSGFTGSGQTNSSLIIHYSFGTATADFPAAAKSDTELDTLVPGLLDPPTGSLYIGPVNVQVVVNGKPSNTLTFSMLALPPNTGPVGATTTTYIDMLSTQLGNEKSALDALGGTPTDLAATLDSFLDATSSAVKDLRDQVTTAAGGGIGLLPGGTTFNQRDVDTLDRMLQSANVLSAGTPSAARIFSFVRSDLSSAKTTDVTEVQAAAQCGTIDTAEFAISAVACAVAIPCAVTGNVLCVTASLLGLFSAVAHAMVIQCESQSVFLSSVSFAPPPTLQLMVGGSAVTEMPTGTFSPLPSVIGQHGTVNAWIDLALRLLSTDLSLTKKIPCLGLLLRIPGVRPLLDSILSKLLDSTGPNSAIPPSELVPLTTATVSLLFSPPPNPNPPVSISELTVTPISVGNTSLYLDLSKFLLLDPSNQLTDDSTKVTGNQLAVEVVTPPPPRLSSISVTPANQSIQTGQNLQFTATGTFSDGSTQNLTTSVTWSSSNTAIATISNTAGSQGLATASANTTGTATITAIDPATQIQGSTNLTVTSATAILQSISITAASASVNVGATVQFTATGHFSDGSSSNITNSVTWTSDNPSVATINSAGVATGVGVGTANITASKNAITSNTFVLTVLVAAQASRCAYVANLLSNNVSAYTVDATGKLGLVPGSPFDDVYAPANLGGGSLAADPSGRFLYVANSGAPFTDVSAFMIDASCALTKITGSPFSQGSILVPSAVAVHPSGKFLYMTANQETGLVACFGIGSSGALTQCSGSPAPAGQLTNSMALYPTGGFAYATNLGGNISGYKVDTAGNLTPIDGSPFADNCQSPGTCLPMAIALDPLGRFAYVANSGATTCVYTIEVNSGKLSPRLPCFVEPNLHVAGFTWVTVHPSGNFVLASALAFLGAPGFATVYRVDSNGDLSVVSGSPFPAGSDPSSIAVDGSGRFVYVTNATSNNISCYTIDSNMGILTSIDCGVSRTSLEQYPISVITTGTPAASSRLQLLWGQMAVPVAGLSEPDGLAVDGNGNLYFSDYNGGSPDDPTVFGIPAVVRFDPQGNQTAVLTSGVDSPYGVAADANGNVFVADEQHNRVVKVNPQGQQSTLVDADEVQAVTVDNLGNVYAADYIFVGGNNIGSEITKVDTQGTVTRTPVNGEPISIAAGLNGTLYAVLGGAPSRSIVTISPQGIETTIPVGQSAECVGADTSGNLYVGTSPGLLKIDAQGNQTVIGDGLSGPQSIAVDGSGNIYVVDILAVTGNTTPSRVLKIQKGPSVEVGIVSVGQSAQAVLTYQVPSGITVGSVSASGVSSSGEFAVPEGGNCTPSGGKCSFPVVFTPVGTGMRSGNVILYDQDRQPLLTTPLYGVGR
jgi:6-phosphogluconolactonase (cycloisomerase 2 family)